MTVLGIVIACVVAVLLLEVRTAIIAVCSTPSSLTQNCSAFLKPPLLIAALPSLNSSRFSQRLCR